MNLLLSPAMQEPVPSSGMAIGGEIVLILILLVVNGIFAMSELAVVTARRSRLEHRAAAGDRRARVAIEMADEPGPFLSTVQIGITLVGTFAGAFGGATIAEQMAPVIAEAVPAVAQWAEGISLAIVVGAITYLSLIMGELVPKRIALAHPETVARLVAPPMKRLAALARPLVWLLATSTEFVLRLLRFRKVDDRGVTEEDLRATIAQGTIGGAIRREEQEILERVLHLDDRQVVGIMVPRSELAWFDSEEEIAGLFEMARTADEAWILVGKGSIDDLAGVVRARDVLVAAADRQRFDLDRHLLTPAFVPESLTALQVLEKFRTETAIPLVVVLDEFGGVSGVLAFDDLAHRLLGTAGGKMPTRIIPPGTDGRWQIPGSAPLAELLDATGLELDEEELEQHHTVAGFIMSRFGRVPEVGESCAAGGYLFTVAALSGRRIEKLEAVRIVDSLSAEPAPPADD